MQATQQGDSAWADRFLDRGPLVHTSGHRLSPIVSAFACQSSLERWPAHAGHPWSIVVDDMYGGFYTLRCTTQGEPKRIRSCSCREASVAQSGPQDVATTQSDRSQAEEVMGSSPATRKHSIKSIV